MPGPGIMLPCLRCGETTPSEQVRRGRCRECYREYRAIREQTRQRGPEQRQDRYGPANTAWKLLSKRARAAQPWCSDCRETEAQITARGDRLECDHKPEAWAASLAREPLFLDFVDVVCGRCNRKRGPAKPGSKRYKDWEAQNG